MSTNTTALCRGYPLANLQYRTYPFVRLVLEFLHKCPECEVRNLFTPKFFHSAQVKVFKEQYVKIPTQVYCEFPMMVCSLIRSLLMDTRNGLALAFLVVRPFDLAGIYFLCFCQCLGVVFVEHWRRIGLTVRASQEVFDTKVEPFSFTCLGFIFDFTIVFSKRDIHVSECVSCHLNLLDFAFVFHYARRNDTNVR